MIDKNKAVKVIYKRHELKKWEVFVPEEARASEHFDLKEKAVHKAIKIARDLKVGLISYKRDGSLDSRNSYDKDHSRLR